MDNHSNIVQYKFCSRFDNYWLIGMEYAAYGTLLNMCRRTRKRTINDEKASKIIKAILQGV